MHIGVLGATSEIAQDLIRNLLIHEPEAHLWLYARSPEKARDRLGIIPNFARCKFLYLDEFSWTIKYDALINFIGAGDPKKINLLEHEIVQLTDYYDELALRYLCKNPTCRYIFLSSGAVYDAPPKPTELPRAISETQSPGSGAYVAYASAKRAAESRHRILSDFTIFDLRLFNYFSHTQNMEAGFLMAEAVRSIQGHNILRTSNQNIIRDYLNPGDFFSLIRCALNAPHLNVPLDCYSLAPIDKFSLLSELSNAYGLRYQVSSSNEENVLRSSYYPSGRAAESIGYKPSLTSVEGVLSELDKFFRIHSP